MFHIFGNTTVNHTNEMLSLVITILFIKPTYGKYDCCSIVTLLLWYIELGNPST